MNIVKRDIISFEYNKDFDYTYNYVIKLIKAAYSEFKKINPFEPSYKDILKIILLSNLRLINDELLR